MKYRRIFFFFLLLATATCLSGCGAFQTQMAKTTTRMARLESFHTDAEAYLEGDFNVGGQQIHLNAAITGDFDTQTDPLLLRTDLQLEAIGQKWDIRYYITKEYDTWRFIPWDEDRTMDEMTMEMRAAKRSRTTQALKLLIKCGEYFAEPVTDSVNGLQARRYDGVFPDEYVDEALILLNLKESDIPAGASPSIKPSERAKASPYPSVDQIPDEGRTGKIAGLPCSIWVNEENMIMRVDVDLSSFLQKLLDLGLDTLDSDFDLDDLILDAELQIADLRLTFSHFNEVPTIMVPEH